MDQKQSLKVLLGFTGSVATIKAQQLIEQIQSELPFAEIKIICTERAKHFMPEGINLIDDNNEWASWKNRGDPVLHIELRKWANILIIAPLSANTMAKIVNGVCDNLLTCVVRAWDYSISREKMVDLDTLISPVKLLNKPIIVCPAMNTFMYENPITEKHLKKLTKMNIIQIQPITKVLMCGESGIGAMAEVNDIVNIILQVLQI